MLESVAMSFLECAPPVGRSLQSPAKSVAELDRVIRRRCLRRSRPGLRAGANAHLGLEYLFPGRLAESLSAQHRRHEADVIVGRGLERAGCACGVVLVFWVRFEIGRAHV